MADLHETHRWGQRRYEGEWIPVCTDCRVDGFEDEPQAFEECPGPPVKKTAPCHVTMESRDTPGHIHACLGGHSAGDHFCRECRRWFGVAR